MDVLAALEDVEVGPAQMDKHKWDLTAFHEAGHAIASLYGESANHIRFATITPRGKAAGYVASAPKEDSFQKTKEELYARIVTALAGRAAEEMAFGSNFVTAGASSDFQVATQVKIIFVFQFQIHFSCSNSLSNYFFIKIAKRMVLQWGMEDVGLEVFKDEDLQQNSLSEETLELLEERVEGILKGCYSQAKSLLKEHSLEHRRLSNALLQYETLSGEEIGQVIKGKSIRGDKWVPDSPPTRLAENKISKYDPKKVRQK